MAGHRDKLAGLDCQIAEAVAEREDLILRIPGLPPRIPEKADAAARHRNTLNEPARSAVQPVSPLRRPALSVRNDWLNISVKKCSLDDVEQPRVGFVISVRILLKI
jgi:hypothetical protein